MNNTEALNAKPGATAQNSEGSPSIPQGSSGELYAGPVRRLATLVFYLLIALVAFRGWYLRGDGALHAESGAGYWLGIVGTLLMLLLILYPLRKNWRPMRQLGAIRHWFKVHMVLGVVGPLLILFHTNFALGSLNSRVALISTLLVAGSGLVGMYFYTQIHYGLYGRQVELQELQVTIEANHNVLGHALAYAPNLKDRLFAFETAALRPTGNLLHSIWRLLTLGVRAQWTHLHLIIGLRRALKLLAQRKQWDAERSRMEHIALRRLVAVHLLSVRRVAFYSFYERLFALWHFFHMPLFLLMTVAVLVHVVAVHMF